MKKIFALSMMLLVMLLIIPIFSSTILAQKPIELKIGYNDPPNNFTTMHITTPWTNRIEEATNGRVKFVHYPSNTLFPAAQALNALETGIIDAGWSPISAFPGILPLTEVMFLPFLSSRVEAEVFTSVVNELYDTTPEIQKEYDNVNIKLLNLTGLESYFIWSVKKPIHTLEDLKGLKIRVSGRIPTKALEKLGATPVHMMLADVYDAAAKGVLDGALLSRDMVDAWVLHQVFPYATKVPLWSSIEYWAMNKDTWDGLPQDIQEQIMGATGVSAALIEARTKYGPLFEENFEAAQKKDKKEVTWYTLPSEEVLKWKEKAGPSIWEEWVKEMEEKGLPGKDVLEKTQKLFEKYANF